MGRFVEIRRVRYVCTRVNGQATEYVFVDMISQFCR